MTKRFDELDKYYHNIKKLGDTSAFIFWITAILSALMLWPNQNPLIYDVFIVSVIIHFTLSSLNILWLIPNAERFRRKHLITNSLGVPLSTDITQHYYNNSLPPSIIKLGANIMENAFFTKNICSEMAKLERLKLIYLIFWLFIILNQSTELNIKLSLTIFLFSENILGKWIRLEILINKNKAIYEQLHTLFLNKPREETPEITATIIDSISEYETAKAAAYIKLSSKTFAKRNATLTEEWREIRAQLRIDK